jgi:hypothetical protein
MRLLRPLLYHNSESRYSIQIDVEEKEFIVNVRYVNPEVNNFEKRFTDEDIMFSVIEKNFGVLPHEFNLAPNKI